MPVQPINHATTAAATLAAGGKASALRNLPKSEQVRAAAGQFEAIIVRQLLQESVGKIMGKGPAGDMYGFMLTDTIANKITEGGGLGLSQMLAQQLTPRGQVDAAAGTNEEKP